MQTTPFATYLSAKRLTPATARGYAARIHALLGALNVEGGPEEWAEMLRSGRVDTYLAGLAPSTQTLTRAALTRFAAYLEAEGLDIGGALPPTRAATAARGEALPDDVCRALHALVTGRAVPGARPIPLAVLHEVFWGDIVWTPTDWMQREVSLVAIPGKRPRISTDDKAPFLLLLKHAQGAADAPVDPDQVLVPADTEGRLRAPLVRLQASVEAVAEGRITRLPLTPPGAVEPGELRFPPPPPGLG